MQLGFMTAILPELQCPEVLRFASEAGFRCVEVMCWPTGKAERRYAGVSHIDVTSSDNACDDAVSLAGELGVTISSLGYYPNPLAADESESKAAVEHIHRLIDASADAKIGRVTTFIGRDPARSVDDQWQRMLDTWGPIVEHADQKDVKVGIENCPMLFTKDEWPGGKNLAYSPAIWRRLFTDLPSPNFGLNFDPSHCAWLAIDPLAALREFADRLHHLHAKDVRVDLDRLSDVGILAHPLEYHVPKLPGLGDVEWGPFFSVLTDVGYDGPVCVEVEDRAYEGSLERRKDALRQSLNFLRNFVPG